MESIDRIDLYNQSINDDDSIPKSLYGFHIHEFGDTTYLKMISWFILMIAKLLVIQVHRANNYIHSILLP